MKLTAYQKNPIVQSFSVAIILLSGYIFFNGNEPSRQYQIDDNDAITLSDISQDSLKMYSYFFYQMNSDYQKTNDVRRFCNDLFILNKTYPEGAKRARLVNSQLHDEILTNCTNLVK